MIFKVQRPTFSMVVDPPILVYNEDRSVCVTLSLTPELDALLDTANKVYVHAIYHGEGRFTWGEQAPSQPW